MGTVPPGLAQPQARPDRLGRCKFLDHEASTGKASRLHGKKPEKGRIVAGGSTIISQQLAKTCFSSRKTRRKAEEAIITVMLEGMMSKQRIFEIYLNVIEWGDGVFGAERPPGIITKPAPANCPPPSSPAGRHGAQSTLFRQTPHRP